MYCNEKHFFYRKRVYFALLIILTVILQSMLMKEKAFSLRARDIEIH